MENHSRLQLMRNEAWGQSLVETALFLPILLLLIAGILEVSNLLVTQNRVQTAARAGTGFGATNYDEDLAIEDTFEAMSRVARNNVTETLDLAPQRWDIYTVKATVNEDGDGFSEWQTGHPFGDNQVFAQSDWTAPAYQDVIKADILAALTITNTVDASGLEIVATIPYHNRDSFIGLDFFDPGLTRIRGLTVMRISEASGSNAGCQLFPIAFNADNVSLYPENYSGTMVERGEPYDLSFWEGGQSYRSPDRDYNYNDDPHNHEGFPYAVGGHRLGLREAVAGDIFHAREVAHGTGNFQWLSWDGSLSAPALRASLRYPGNLTMVVPAPEGMVNYVNPYNASDHIPNVGDWVQGTTGNINANEVRELLDEALIDTGRAIQIVVFDQDSPTVGANYNYRILGFALVYLRARNTGGSDKQILVEFIDWAVPCFEPGS